MSQADIHDVVIVGAGVAGALIAKRLTGAGLKVLVLEAGPGTTRTYDDYAQHLEHFYAATSKGTESPWPPSVGGMQPDGGDLQKAGGGYFVQNGPLPYASTYTRYLGGSTLHWLGVSLRMLPEDFRMKTLHGVGRDWPLSYDDLAPYYAKAEHEIGVSADVAEQRYLGHHFPEGYDYPMHRVPPSYSDRVLGAAVNGLRLKLGETSVAVRVRTYPAGRNSIPRGRYRPKGAVNVDAEGVERPVYLGERCEGNTSCTPICPVQAKYNAGKSLAQADHRRLEIRSQAVASKVVVDPASGQVQAIRYQRYDDPQSTTFTEHEAKARYYVVAAHAVENAKLLLASGLGGESGQLGRNLMDHPALYAWGLAPFAVGAFRGPQSTSGIEEFRGGAFRSRHAAFRFDIGNDGWRSATGSPDSDVADAVLSQGLYGARLRQRLADQLPRQVRFSLAVEQMPSAENRVSIDPRYVDGFGNPRPVLNYHIDDYTFEGMIAAQDVAQAVFRQAGVVDRTDPKTEVWFPTATYGGRQFHYHGMGHFSGTHGMGDDPATSVVDPDQRAWGHSNLFVVGSGSFPTMGTSNPTLTLAALALRTADRLVERFSA